MKRTIGFLFLMGASGLYSLTGTFAQPCEAYIPTEINTLVETQSFDAKDKLTGSSTAKIIDVVQNGANMTISVESESFDAKSKSTGKNTYTYKCENGVFTIDMKNYLDPSSYEGVDEASIAISGDDMDIPANLQVGQTLNDATVKLDIMAEGGVVVMSTEIRMYNRKVEAIEDITTPAGTFKCYKLSYTMDTKAAFFKMTSKGVTWYSKNVGAVRSETYDAAGKLLGYSQISKIVK